MFNYVILYCHSLIIVFFTNSEELTVFFIKLKKHCNHLMATIQNVTNQLASNSELVCLRENIPFSVHPAKLLSSEKLTTLFPPISTFFKVT